jgi:hypothetical protein
MASNKKLSSLTIAAAAFFAAAIPCFAQAQANESRNDAATLAAINVAEPILVLNRENPAPKEVSATVTSDHQPRLSPAMFKQQPDQFSASRTFMKSTTNLYEPRVQTSKSQFRVGDELAPAPRVAFVPSRGQKLPDAAILMH